MDAVQPVHEWAHLFGDQHDLVPFSVATVIRATSTATVSGAASPSASTVHCGCIMMLSPLDSALSAGILASLRDKWQYFD